MFKAISRFIQWVISESVVGNRRSVKRGRDYEPVSGEVLEERVLLTVTATWNAATGQLSAYASAPADPSVEIIIKTNAAHTQVLVFDGTDLRPITGGLVDPGDVKKIYTAGTNQADKINLEHVKAANGFDPTKMDSIEIIGYDGKVYGLCVTGAYRRQRERES